MVREFTQQKKSESLVFPGPLLRAAQAKETGCRAPYLTPSCPALFSVIWGQL